MENQRGFPSSGAGLYHHLHPLATGQNGGLAQGNDPVLQRQALAHDIHSCPLCSSTAVAPPITSHGTFPGNHNLYWWEGEPIRGSNAVILNMPSTVDAQVPLTIITHGHGLVEHRYIPLTHELFEHRYVIRPSQETPPAQRELDLVSRVGMVQMGPNMYDPNYQMAMTLEARVGSGTSSGYENNGVDYVCVDSDSIEESYEEMDLTLRL